MRLHGCGPFTKALSLGLIPAVVDDKAVFLLQLPAQLVAFDIVPPGLHTRELFRVDQVVGDVHVHVLGVDVDAAMPLMLRQTQCLGKAFLNGFECFRRQPGFIFRPETHNQVIGFLLGGARIKRLGIGHFLNGQLVIVPRPNNRRTSS